MTDRPAWVPDSINTELPSAARVYDYLLGGGHNFAIDRVVGEKVLQVLPNGGQIAGSNRAFLRRAVLFMIERGITQFLDLGSGIPTVGNVHEIAQHADPNARVVYVDYDEVAVTHSELLLQGNDNATVVAADATRPDRVLSAPAVREMLDFSKPVGLLMVAVLHFIPDEKKPRDVLAQYIEALPSGSLVALSHLTADGKPEEMAAVVEAMKNSRDPMYFRSHAEFSTMFNGLEVLDPGIVSAPHWHPEVDYDTSPEDVYAAVGRKP